MPDQVTLEDGTVAKLGDRVFNYYDRRAGRILRIREDGWCDLDNGDFVDGSRMCSTAYASQRGWME